jgi:glutaminase
LSYPGLGFLYRAGETSFIVAGEGFDVAQRASTGRLPSNTQIDDLVRRVHRRLSSVEEGTVADYIPALAEANPDWFGIAFATAGGSLHLAGDVAVGFSLQSVSKAFVFALVREAYGHGRVEQRVGANNTGLPFDSVIAVELNHGHPMNPMVNAGAIATTALVPGGDHAERWSYIHGGLSRFAGRRLELDEAVYDSESRSNQRNRAVALLLASYGRLTSDPGETIDNYTRQCALSVTAEDLAVMGATLADGGTNPVTGERVVSEETSRDTLAVLAACGLYERSGEWLYDIGLPAKSGVSGGIVAIAPGKGAVGVFSPRLDASGNSVRGQRACGVLSRGLGLNLFASSAAVL